MNTDVMKKAIAAGLISLTALGAASFAPAVADAQETTQEAPTEEAREARSAERQANRETRRAERVAVVTDALGVGEDVLQAAREAGQSLADVAADQGVEVESVVSAIVDSKTTQIQDQVTEGNLTQEEANERIAGLAERVTERVNATPGERSDSESSDGERSGRRGPGGERDGAAPADA